MFTIKFLPGDPRAGQIAQMDSHRGQQLIDSGAAERYDARQIASAQTPETTAAVAAPEQAAVAGAPKRQSKTAAPENKAG